MSDNIPQSIRDKEPALVELLELLEKLPRFDRAKKAREHQGDLDCVYEAERLFHSFNRKYATRKKDKQGRSYVEYQPVLLELFKLDSWQNFRKLVRHTPIGRERKQRTNQKHRDKIKKSAPKTWFEACRTKRRARLEAWETANHPRLLRLLAAAEQLEHTNNDTDRTKAEALRFKVLNELEAKYVCEGPAFHEYLALKMRVLLGLFTCIEKYTDAANQLESKLTKLSTQLWDEAEARTALMAEIAKRYPAIATDWVALDQAMESSEVAAGSDDQD